MPRRQYCNEIATVLHHIFDAYSEHIVYDDCPVYPTVVHHINSIFFNENPNFNFDQFFAASGYDEYAAMMNNKDFKVALQHTLTTLVRALGSLIRSPERIYLTLSCMLTPADKVIALGFVDEASGCHEPCNEYDEDCSGQCLKWLEERDEVIVIRWFGCKFYFQVFSN
jgi:hypothetical protein